MLIDPFRKLRDNFRLVRYSLPIEMKVVSEKEWLLLKGVFQTNYVLFLEGQKELK